MDGDRPEATQTLTSEEGASKEPKRAEALINCVGRCGLEAGNLTLAKLRNRQGPLFAFGTLSSDLRFTK